MYKSDVVMMRINMNIFMLVVMDDSRKRFRIDIMIIIGYPTRMFGVIYI